MVKHLGVITVVASGSRVRATSTQVDPTKRVVCQAFMVQAHPDNSGIGVAGDSTVLYSTMVGAWGIIGSPSGTTIIPAFVAKHNAAPGPFNLADLYLDASTANQSFIISYVA